MSDMVAAVAVFDLVVLAVFLFVVAVVAEPYLRSRSRKRRSRCQLRTRGTRLSSNEHEEGS